MFEANLVIYLKPCKFISHNAISQGRFHFLSLVQKSCNNIRSLNLLPPFKSVEINDSVLQAVNEDVRLTVCNAKSSFKV